MTWSGCSSSTPTSSCSMIPPGCSRRSRRAGAGRGRRRRHRPLQRAWGVRAWRDAGHPGVRAVLQRRRHGDLTPRLAERDVGARALRYLSTRGTSGGGFLHQEALNAIAWDDWHRARPALERPREPRRSPLLGRRLPPRRGNRPLRGTHEAVAGRRRRSLRHGVPRTLAEVAPLLPRPPSASASATGR